MDRNADDRAFAGSIPRLYERHLVPLIFEPYAADLAARVAACRPSRVLEVAAGTGAVTRQLARLLPAEASIVATDLNRPMLDEAAAVGTDRPVEWRQADATDLPFPDAAFDVVACQFGVMFFPDKARAYAEARRVLRPGGSFVFNVWDRIEDERLRRRGDRGAGAIFPDDPPRFLARMPHGCHDTAAIAADLARAGFAHPPRVRGARRAQPGGVGAHPGAGLLPGHAAAQRDRGPRPGAARRGDRRRRGGDRATLRRGGGRRRHPGARRHGRAVGVAGGSPAGTSTGLPARQPARPVSLM